MSAKGLSQGKQGRVAVVLAGIALLALTNVAWAEGNYQKTKEGKTLVWNNSPKPADIATWSGSRDEEDYAKGFGTLTWYTARHENKPEVYAHYFGNMVHGKFDGPVNVHSKGRTEHAFFVDGRRTTRWTNGPAPSRRVAEQQLAYVRQKRTGGTERFASSTTANGGATQTEKPTLKLPAEGPPPPAEGPSQKAGGSPPAAAASVDRSTSATEQRTSDSSPAAAPVRDSLTADAKGLPEKPAGTPSVDSVRKLARPPHSLATAGSPEQPSAAGDTPSPAAPSARLGEDEVIQLAEKEARAHGCNPGEYQRPEPQFDPTDQTWLLFYNQKPVNGAAKTGKHFTVGVDDKTRKTSFVLGR